MKSALSLNHIGFKMSNLKAIAPLTHLLKRTRRKEKKWQYIPCHDIMAKESKPTKILMPLSLYITITKESGPIFFLGGCLVEGLKQK